MKILTCLPDILNKINQLVEQLPDVDENEPHYAAFIRYDDSALLCQLRAHITKTDRVGFLKVQEAILLLINKVVSEEGGIICLPDPKDS